MSIDVNCLTCCVKQAYSAILNTEKTPSEKFKALQNVLRHLSEVQESTSCKALIKQLSNNLYSFLTQAEVAKKRSSQQESNEELIKALEELERNVGDPLKELSKLILINKEKANLSDFHKQLNTPFEIDHFEDFKSDLSQSTSFLYICDKRTDLLFDKYLLKSIRETQPHVQIYVALREKGFLDFASVVDGYALQLDEIAEFIPMGDQVFGCFLEKTPEIFRRTFFNTDLVLAKGQLNYITLQEERKKDVYFAFKTECVYFCTKHMLSDDSLIFCKGSTMHFPS